MLQPVREALARGPVPISQAVKIVDRVCEILSAMHVAGRPHGAVHAGTVRFHHVGGDLTVELDPPGKLPPTYTPPEIARGLENNARSDIYQVGVLLYHIISGRPPFEGGSDDDVLRLHMSATPASLEEHELQDVPRELNRLVMEMLSKNPKSRPKSVEHVRSRIANLELDSTVMGMRLEALKEAARDLGSATPEEQQEDVPTRLSELPSPEDDDITILPNPPVMRPPIEAPVETLDPNDAAVVPVDQSGVDPFADTFIRHRADFDLDADETQMTLPPERSPIGPNVVSESRSAAVREPSLREPTYRSVSADQLPVGPRPTPPVVLGLIAVGVFAVTLVVILLFAG